MSPHTTGITNNPNPYCTGNSHGHGAGTYAFLRGPRSLSDIRLGVRGGRNGRSGTRPRIRHWSPATRPRPDTGGLHAFIAFRANTLTLNILIGAFLTSHNNSAMMPIYGLRSTFSVMLSIMKSKRSECSIYHFGLFEFCTAYHSNSGKHKAVPTIVKNANISN